MLIDDALTAGDEDGSEHLSCNSALAVPCATFVKLTPRTTSSAKAADWQGRIPWQHQTGNGHLYSTGFTADDEAARALMTGLDREAPGSSSISLIGLRSLRYPVLPGAPFRAPAGATIQAPHGTALRIGTQFHHPA